MEKYYFCETYIEIDGNLFGSDNESGISEQKQPDRFPMQARMCSAWVKPSRFLASTASCRTGRSMLNISFSLASRGQAVLLIGCRVVYLGYCFDERHLYIRQLFLNLR